MRYQGNGRFEEDEVLMIGCFYDTSERAVVAQRDMDSAKNFFCLQNIVGPLCPIVRADSEFRNIPVFIPLGKCGS